MSTVDLVSLHVPLRRRLARLRRSDGGFPMSLDGPSEVEATVVAALALTTPWPRDGCDRDSAPTEASTSWTNVLRAQPRRRWLHWRFTGRRLARRSTSSSRNEQRLLPGATAPDDHLGWGWASNPADARAFVEPTARALTAVKALAPENASARSEAVRVLTRLQCADGGWNYGTASVNAVDLRGYAQTTAIALVGLQGESSALAESGLRFLRRSFPVEPGRADHGAVAPRVPPPWRPRLHESCSSTPSRRSRGGARSSTVRSPSRGLCSPPDPTR